MKEISRLPVTGFVAQAARTPAMINESANRMGPLQVTFAADDRPLCNARTSRSGPVAASTLAGLAAGPHAAKDAAERARRQDRLQRTEATFEPLPIDGNVARAYSPRC